MRKIYLTESQLRSIMKEVALSGDEALNTTNNIQSAARDTIENAKESGMNVGENGTSVSFSADTLRKHGLAEDVEDGNGDVINGINTKYVAEKIVGERRDDVEAANNARELYSIIYETLDDIYGDDFDDEAFAQSDIYVRVMKHIDDMINNGDGALYECYTKKQIQEARIKKILGEAKAVYTKKDFLTHKRK